jgi:hypothetical protein
MSNKITFNNGSEITAMPTENTVRSKGYHYEIDMEESLSKRIEEKIQKEIEDSLLKAFGMDTTTCTSTYARNSIYNLSELKNTIREIQKNQIYIKIDDYVPDNKIITIDWEKFRENAEKDMLLLYEPYEDKYYGKQFSMNSKTAKKMIEGYPEMKCMIKNIEKLK